MVKIHAAKAAKTSPADVQAEQNRISKEMVSPSHLFTPEIQSILEKTSPTITLKIKELRSLLEGLVTHAISMKEKAISAQIHSWVRSVFVEYPALRCLEDQLINPPEATGIELAKRIIEVFGAVSSLVNHTGDMELDENGEIKNKSFPAVAMSTDLRGSSQIAEKLQDKTIEVLEGIYLGPISNIIKQFHGRIIDTAGDGFMVYFRDHEQPDGTVMSKEELAVLCACKLNSETNWIAHELLKEGWGTVQAPHYTGIGMDIGMLHIGEGFRMVGARMPKELQNLHQKLLRRTPHFQGKGIRKFIAAGPVLNHAARLESTDPKFFHHNGMISDQLFQALPPYLQLLFDDLGEHDLKGIGKVHIHAMRRHPEKE